MREWRRRHPGYNAEKKRVYNQANREKINAAARERRVSEAQNGKTRSIRYRDRRAYQAAYYAMNRNMINARKRERYAEKKQAPE